MKHKYKNKKKLLPRVRVRGNIENLKKKKITIIIFFFNLEIKINYRPKQTY